MPRFFPIAIPLFPTGTPCLVITGFFSTAMVLEPAETPEKESQAGEVVSLASWSDATLTSLKTHKPEPTGVVIVLESQRSLSVAASHAVIVRHCSFSRQARPNL